MLSWEVKEYKDIPIPDIIKYEEHMIERLINASMKYLIKCNNYNLNIQVSPVWYIFKPEYSKILGIFKSKRISSEEYQARPCLEEVFSNNNSLNYSYLCTMAFTLRTSDNNKSIRIMEEEILAEQGGEAYSEWDILSLSKNDMSYECRFYDTTDEVEDIPYYLELIQESGYEIVYE